MVMRPVDGDGYSVAKTGSLTTPANADANRTSAKNRAELRKVLDRSS
jgi:hypothetical protein